MDWGDRSLMRLWNVCLYFKFLCKCGTEIVELSLCGYVLIWKEAHCHTRSDVPSVLSLGTSILEYTLLPPSRPVLGWICVWCKPFSCEYCVIVGRSWAFRTLDIAFLRCRRLKDAVTGRHEVLLQLESYSDVYDTRPTPPAHCPLNGRVISFSRAARLVWWLLCAW